MLDEASTCTCFGSYQATRGYAIAPWSFFVHDRQIMASRKSSALKRQVPSSRPQMRPGDFLCFNKNNNHNISSVHRVRQAQPLQSMFVVVIIPVRPQEMIMKRANGTAHLQNFEQRITVTSGEQALDQRLCEPVSLLPVCHFTFWAIV